jgi:hypothetical protein
LLVVQSKEKGKRDKGYGCFRWPATTIGKPKRNFRRT